MAKTIKDLTSEERAIAVGAIWLNDAFKKNATPIRIAKTGVRVNMTQIIVFSISLVFLILIALTFQFIIMKIFRFIPSELALVPYALSFMGAIVTAYQFGKRSPYTRYTGEGLSSYLWVQADKRDNIFIRMFGGKVATNEIESWARKNETGEKVNCVEWLGSYRNPRMPKSFIKISDNAWEIVEEEHTEKEKFMGGTLENTKWKEYIKQIKEKNEKRARNINKNTKRGLF